MTENRHGMDEFNTRLSKVEQKLESQQNEMREFKDMFHEHNVQERSDRKEIIRNLKDNKDSIECIKRSLAKFDGWKGGVLFTVAVVGGLIALAFKKLFGG